MKHFKVITGRDTGVVVRELSISLDSSNWLRSAVPAILSVLAMRNVSPSGNNFALLGYGIHYALSAIATGRPLQGKIPKGLLQLFSQYRPRRIEYGGQGFVLDVTVTAMNAGHFGSAPDTPEACWRESIQLMSQMGVPLYDVMKIMDDRLDGVALGGIAAIGSDAIGDSGRLFYKSMNVQDTEHWMVPFSAYTSILSPDVGFVPWVAIWTADPTNDVYFDIATQHLCAALLYPEIFDCNEFQYPVTNLYVFAHFIRRDLLARTPAVTLAVQDAVHLARLALARTALVAGQLEYWGYYLNCNVYQLPLSISEAAQALVNFRGKVCRLVRVDSSSDAMQIVAGTNTVTVGDSVFITSPNATRTARSAIENTYDQAVAGQYLVKVTNQFATSNTYIAAALTTAELEKISKTISTGPLSTVSTSASAGRLLFGQLEMEVTVTSTATSVVFANPLAVNYYGDVPLGSYELRQIAIQPLCFPVPLTTSIGTIPQSSIYKWTQRLQVSSGSVSAYVRAMVTEASAQRTRDQSMWEEIANLGLGADSLLSKITKGLGRMALTMGRSYIDSFPVNRVRPKRRRRVTAGPVVPRERGMQANAGSNPLNRKNPGSARGKGSGRRRRRVRGGRNLS